MNSELRQRVWARAGHCCEYCRLPQSASPASTFHIEHVVARQHHGMTVPENLALACDRCNFYKGPNLSAIDPATMQVVPIFHPRRDVWMEHFVEVEFVIRGVTPVGRATVRLLNMNSAARVRLRAEIVGGE